MVVAYKTRKANQIACGDREHSHASYKVSDRHARKVSAIRAELCCNEVVWNKKEPFAYPSLLRRYSAICRFNYIFVD